MRDRVVEPAVWADRSPLPAVSRARLGRFRYRW
jgi:hypothetical protein